MMLLRISHHQQGVLVSGKQGEKQKEGKENHELVDKVVFWQDLLMFAEYSVKEAREGNNLLPAHDSSHTPLRQLFQRRSCCSKRNMLQLAATLDLWGA